MQLVADANVLLSAVIGGRASLALRHDKIEQVFTPAAAYDEVFEYVPSLARKKRLDLDTLLLACAALPVTVVERSEYDVKLSTARRRIGKRDPVAAQASLRVALSIAAIGPEERIVHPAAARRRARLPRRRSQSVSCRGIYAACAA